MRTILTAFAALGGALAVSAAPALAQGHSHHHRSHHHHGHHHHHHHHSYQPTYVAPTYYKPAYVAPTYYAPKVVYAAPAPVATIEKTPAYVYAKVAGHCTEKVIKYGYGHTTRHSLGCMADAPKVIVETPAPPVELK